MKQFSTKNIIIAFFVIAFLFIGFFVITTYKNMKQTQAQNNKSNAALRVLSAVEKILAQTDQLESARQNYREQPGEQHERLISGAKKELAGYVTLLDQMASVDLSRQNELYSLSRLVNKKIADTLYPGAPGYDIRLSDSLKTAILQIQNEDFAVINSSNSYLEEIARKTTSRFFLLAAIFFLILIFFMVVVSGEFRKGEKIASQLRYQASLIDTIPDAIFTTDRNFIIKTWNKYAAELYGISEKDAINLPMNALFTIDNSPEEKERTFAVLNITGSYKDEYRILKRSNDAIFVLASISTIVTADGEISGYVAVHRDITERKKLEDRQKEFSLELAKEVKIKTAETTNILERITDGFLALDSNLTFTFVNKKAAEILGYAPSQMIGKNIFTGFPGVASNAFNEACEKSFSSQQYTFLENHYAPLNLWLENDIYPSPDGLSIFFKDSTFKKNVETALKESEERYRHLIEYIHAGVVVHRPDSSILLYNQEAARLLGIKNCGIEGTKASAPEWFFFSAEGKKLTVDEYPVSQVINTGLPVNNIIAGIDNAERNTRFWLLVNAFPEMDENMQLKQVVVTFVDITDRKKAEEELKRSEDNLNMAQSIARIGSWEFDFASRDLRWSKELYNIFELEHIAPDELYEKYRNKFHTEDLSKLDAMMQQSIENKKGYSYQHRIIANNGTIKHILGIGEPVLNANGDLVGLKGTGQDITGLIKAEEKLQSSYRQIKQLVTHLQEIREQERTNMAREIHDELGQQLTGLKMYISWLNKKVLSDDNDIKEKFNAAIELIEETIKSVRKISMDLRPSMLDDLGLLAALEWQSNEFEKRSGINTEFVNQTGNREIPSRLKTGLFRIYQESLTNVARHADAKKIVSSLKFDKNNLVLTITDDGKGFAFKNIESKKTLGLFGMKERTIEMGGKYEIKSEPGKGTTVSVIVPLNA